MSIDLLSGFGGRQNGSRARWCRIALLATIGLAMSPASAIGAPLSSQRVEGTNRICTYQDTRAVPGQLGDLSRVRIGRSPSATRRPHEPLELRIGQGEPCPFWHRPEPAEETQVPSMASFDGEGMADGHRICFYSYLGRRYSRPSASGMSCPLTPNLSD